MKRLTNKEYRDLHAKMQKKYMAIPVDQPTRMDTAEVGIERLVREYFNIKDEDEWNANGRGMCYWETKFLKEIEND